MAEENDTVRKLKELGIPVTRENWLSMAFAGNPPEEIDAELEMEMPPELRDPSIGKFTEEEERQQKADKEESTPEESPSEPSTSHTNRE